MIEERREHIRFPVVRNVGEPVEIRVIVNHKKCSIPGYILNLSESGMGIVTLGHKPQELSVGSTFDMDLNLPKMNTHHVEGRIIRLHRSRKAQEHHSNDEWFIGLRFVKISAAAADHVHQLAEDWTLCEAKIEMHLPDVCFRDCSYWEICEKPQKAKK